MSSPLDNFVRLPNDSLINLALITHISHSKKGETPMTFVYLVGGEMMTLDGENKEAFDQHFVFVPTAGMMR